MSTPPRSSYHHGQLRPVLLAEARAQLDAGGPESVSLRETARRAGVSATATYRHFSDKDSAARGCRRRGFSRIRQGVGGLDQGRSAVCRDGPRLCRVRSRPSGPVSFDVQSADPRARPFSRSERSVRAGVSRFADGGRRGAQCLLTQMPTPPRSPRGRSCTACLTCCSTARFLRDFRATRSIWCSGPQKGSESASGFGGQRLSS